MYIPPLRPNHVTRSRLINLLKEGQQRKLTLVSAPAGYGKSTLLSDWAIQTSRPIAWLSLDERDNVPSRFWSYFAAALRTIPELRQASVGEILLNSLTAHQLPPVEELLTGLVNDIAALPGQHTLILDDLHVISDKQIHAGLVFLLDFLPSAGSGLHLVIVSRVDPPWPLAKLRSRGDLTELREYELRFVGDEVTYYLNQVMALELSLDDISALDTRTEGWIAGLQMAAVSLLRRRESLGSKGVSMFIADFTGSHRLVVDYLVQDSINTPTN